MTNFINVEDALQQILTKIPETSAERVHLNQAAGRVLAEAVHAPENTPRFDNSAMDGFVLRFEDIDGLPATLPIGGVSAAGHPAEEVLKPGQAFRISTGAAIPSGADTVVPRELCEADDHQVTIKELPGHGKGANVRYSGSYLQAGSAALLPGQRLGGAAVGLLASFGRPVVNVFRRPRVAVVSTGDELVELGAKTGPGQIINSNAYMLEALVHEFGGRPQVYPIAADDHGAIRETFRRAISESDLVISSGGVSVGDHDHVGNVLDEICGGMTFWKVRMKPGKPLAFGVVEEERRSVALIGLPGNPASSFVGFHLFVRPALAVAQGIAPGDAPLARVEATLTAPVRGARGRRAYVAGQARATGDGLSFAPFADQSSGNPALFATANALGIVEEGLGGIESGRPIAVHLL